MAVAIIVVTACATSHLSADVDAAVPGDTTVDAVPAPDAGDALTPDEFEAELRVRICAHEIRCAPIDAEDGSCHPAAANQDAVRWRTWPGCGLTFNPAAAARCLTAVEADGCFLEGTDDYQSCAFVYGSPAPAGSSCEISSCGRDQFCGPDSSCRGTDCPWACRLRAREGEACTGGGSRILGLSPTCAEGLDCADGRCLPRTRPGDLCQPASLPCSFPQDCDAGICRGYAVGLGDRCETEGCMGDLHCIGDTSFATCQLGADEGEVCGNDRLCRFAADCVERPPCRTGHRCVDGTCVRLLAPGAACTRTEECPRYFHCEAAGCVPDGVAGDTCDPARPCARGVCDAGICTLVLPGGACEFEPAAFFNELGDCAAGICWTGTCPAYVPVGEPCPESGHYSTTCEPGAECNFGTLLCDWRPICP